jgi:phage gpG-like protein
MTSGVTGDFDRLERLIASARSIQSKPFWRRLLREVSAELNRQITAGFWFSRDPYGKPWKPLRSGLGQPLLKSGALLRAAQSRPVEAITSVVIQVDLVYAGVHQHGAKIRAKRAKALRFRVGGRFIFRSSVEIPARPFLPTGPELPPRWRAGVANVIDAQVTRTLKG